MPTGPGNASAQVLAQPRVGDAGVAQVLRGPVEKSAQLLRGQIVGEVKISR